MKSSVAAGGVYTPPALLSPGEGASSPEPEDQDSGDIPAGVDEDALDYDDVDTDQVASRE